jgi:Icc protein
MPVDTVELTTVADDLAVLHLGEQVFRYEGLQPDTVYELHGVALRTLPRPPGELLARIATVNDLHFGETECGRIDDRPDGPIVRVDPGAEPYPELMNRSAADEIAAIDPTAVIVKGDLSCDGTEAEWSAFEACYSRFGDRLHVTRGNHDAYEGQHRYAGDQWIELPGISIALLDTVVPRATPGDLTGDQIDWLAEHLSAAASDRPVLLLGHHQQWIRGAEDADSSEALFGLQPGASDALDGLCAADRRVIGYAAGHTHRHRVRRMVRSGAASIEVGCVKDFPGAWAEYRVFEGGVMQVVHRVSAPAALAWSNRCRWLYRDFGVHYEAYAMGDLSARCFVFDPR